MCKPLGTVEPMKTPPPDLAARLLARAPELLRPDGVPRFEDVAELVEASRATLYYYFSGQDDLLAFLLAAHVEEGAAAIAAADPGSGPAAERLRSVMTAVVTYLGERPAVCRGLLSAVSSDNELRRVLAVNDAHIARPIRDLLVTGAAHGDLDVPDAADATNAILGAALLAVIGRSADGRDPQDPAFRAAIVDQALRGLSPP